MMAESVIALRGTLLFIQLERRSDECIGHQSYDARGVRLQRQLRHREHEVELLEEQPLVLDVGRGRLSSNRFGLHFPRSRGLQALLYFAHRRDVLIQPSLVVRSQFTTKALGFVQQCVEDAAAAFEPVNLLCYRFFVALHEHPFVQLRRAILGGQQHTVARPGEAPVAFVDVDAEIQCRESRHLP